MISLRRLSVFVIGVALAGHAAAAEPAKTASAKRPVLVELYTSQGCSSCPPADALLGQLAQRTDVLALSLSVTYWDMLGWKDTLASEANTNRQKAYARIMKHGGIYTPQIIVDGTDDVVGSREKSVRSAISARLADSSAIPIALKPAPGLVHVTIGSGPKENEDATVWAFHILNQATVNIGSGENGGRKITYQNVVRDLKPVGTWKGDALSLDLPRHSPSDAPHDGLAIVVQRGGYGRVIGAAFIAKPDYYPL